MKSLKLAAAIPLLALSASAHADEARWIGWSADEARYAYFVRQPYGESGYTSIVLHVRDGASGRTLLRETVRNAAVLLQRDPPPEETPAALNRSEAPSLAQLRRKGYRAGRELPFRVTPRQYELPNEGLSAPPATATLTWQRTPLRFTPTSSLSWSFLRVRRPGQRPPGREVARAPVEAMPFMTGTPEARVIRAPATYPNCFYLSPRRRWMASLWQGRATLPDGFSWPAYVFHFPTVRVRR